MVIWQSFDKGQEATYEAHFLQEEVAETRENASAGGVPVIGPESAPDLPVDYTNLTPGLQKFLREGKLNAEITVDRVR